MRKQRLSFVLAVVAAVLSASLWAEDVTINYGSYARAAGEDGLGGGGGAPLVPEGYTVLKYVSSEASGNPWASNKVGPYLQIYNSDTSPFVLGANDVVETKFNFVEANLGACVFCDRAASSGKFVLMRTGNTGNPGRFDYGTENNEFTSPSLANTSVHKVVASGSSLKIDGTSVAIKSSTYTPSSNALLIFCCDNGGNGVANSGNKGLIKIYYFRVTDGSRTVRLNLVPMKDGNGVAGMYDQVSGQFFKSANSSYALTAGDEASDEDKQEAFLPQSDEPGVIRTPTAKTGLVYTGSEQTGVAEGEGYTLTGNTGTDADNYTATATLTDATNTKWSDETTEPKTINWSIAKATPLISGTLSMPGWTEGETASEPSGLSTSFGTITYAYYSDQTCTASIAKPTTAGTYYVRGEVAADTNWNAANSAAVSFTISAQAGELVLTSPITTEANPIELLTADQKTWLAMDKEVRRGLLSNKTDIPGIPSEWLTKDLALFSGGSPVTFAWEGTTAPCTVSLKRLSDNQTVWTKTGVTGTSLTVYNLEVGAGYEWTVTCGAASESAVFYTSAQTPRLLKAGEMRQVRDLGGWTGLQGCTIRQNVLIRGAAANDGNPPYNSFVDDQALDFFINELGIKHEIDFRKSTESARMQSTAKIDPSGENIEYHNLNIVDYLPTDADLESSTVKAIFDLIFNAKNEPVYFHCAWGRDRTGTIAFLAEALLGVSEEDIWRDYQASATTPTDARTAGTVYSTGETRYSGFANLISTIKTSYPAATLAESASLYFQALGFTKAQIEQFRTDLLIGYVSPEEPDDPSEYPTIRDGHFIADLQAFAATHPVSSPVATGGDIVYAAGDYEYHIFTHGGTLTLAQAKTADILAVGGGGAGGFNCGGGGAGGAVAEVANQALSATGYEVTVGAGGLKNENKEGQGGSGGSSSFATLCTAAGGEGGYGYAASGHESQGGVGTGGGGSGGAASTTGTVCVGEAGGAGTVSSILGVAQYFGGGGGAGNRGDSSSTSAPGGAGGGGAGATVVGSATTTNAEEGEDGLGGGGGGGAGNSGAQAGDKKTADGGSGVVIVRIKRTDAPQPGVVAIPMGLNLTYTGAEQTGVATGTGYELSGTFAATDADDYTATATLTDAVNTKWSDETTEPKTIEWSIAKATPVISGTLLMPGWTEGGTASEPSGLSTSFGTITYAYYSDQTCTASIAKPTTAGTYYVRGEVAADTNWNAANSAAVAFTISAQGSAVTYYKVGEDSGSHTSFSKSDSTTSGWSLTQGGAVDASHNVAAANDYVVPSGTVLRTPSLDPDDTFAGKSLTLAGGTLTLKRATYDTQGTKTVTVQQLVLTDGGVIKNAADKTDFTLAGTSVTIPSGKTGAIEITGGNRRGIIVGSALAGSGTLQLTWQGAGSAPSGQDDYLKLAGDNSGFTGTITAVGDTSVAGTKYTLVLDGAFGGTITSLPKAKTNAIKVNYGNNPGLTVATTTIPEALKTDLLFYGSAGFSTPDLPLMTFPEGTTVAPTEFTIKHASSESGGATAFTGLDTVENANGTITLVANHGSTPTFDASLNFASAEKAIRPALHGCGVAPRTRALDNSSETQILRDAGFTMCRAHDLALHDGAQAIVDFQQIFPLFSKDPEDPRSYRFEPTDRVMSAITNAGMKIVFRLGSCGQSRGDDTDHPYYNNIFTPNDASYAKIASVFSHIIAHYNEGWDNGFSMGIEYWEVWNEPDADPGNRWPSSAAATEFPQLFAKVVKKVKTDHPGVKIGGPATCRLNESFFDSCLSACNTAGACPDFYTFHYYSHYCGAARDPGDLTAAVETMRAHLASKTCAGRSCSELEIGVTEWNYSSASETWSGRLTMEGAAWCAGVAQDLQYSTADFSDWYGAGWNASYGVYNGRDGVLSKTYHCLKMVGRVVKGYTRLAARTDTATLHVLGALDAAGTKGCVMVTDRTTAAHDVTVGLGGFAGKTLSNVKCYLTDDSHDMAEVTTGFSLGTNAPGWLVLTKGTSRSVWLLTFDIAE